MTKSCFNCQYLISWDYSGTLEDPPDSGWECGHKNREHLPFYNSEDEGESDQQFAEYCGKNCPGYQHYDWQDYYKQQSVAEANFHEEVYSNQSSIL